MKKVVSALALALLVPALAQAEEEAYPLFGGIRTGISFSQSNFEDLGGRDAGSVVGTLAGSLVYLLPVEGLSLSGGISMQKALRETFNRGAVGGAVPTQPGRTELSDVGLGLGYQLTALDPVSLSTSLNLTIPLSNASQAAGLITSIAPGLSAGVRIPGGLMFSLGTGFNFNILEESTRQIDCGDNRFKHLCEVTGGAGGLGSPNSLMGFSVSTGLAWSTPLPGLRLSAGYHWGTSISAVKFEDDEFTSEFAQTGTQLSGDGHGTNFGISYTPTPLSAGIVNTIDQNAQPPEVAGAMGILGRFTLSAGMSTNQPFYSTDGTRVTVPVFDFESGLKNHTSYSINLSARL